MSSSIVHAHWGMIDALSQEGQGNFMVAHIYLALIWENPDLDLAVKYSEFGRWIGFTKIDLHPCTDGLAYLLYWTMHGYVPLTPLIVPPI